MIRLRTILVFSAVAAALSAAVGPARAEPPRLGFPVACDFGSRCFIQNYVDSDPGPDARDYSCGGATYDGHTGTDFRVLSDAAAAAGVDVIAAADGVVRAVRDGIPDHRIQSAADRDKVTGRECGNGVVISHGNDIETQYCHMQQGSIAVVTAGKVKRGQLLGRIGASGLAEFAHLHFEVRIGGKPVDPFLGALAGAHCSATASNASSLWSPEVATMLGVPASVLLETGFTTGAIDNTALEAGTTNVDPPTADAPAVVFFARLVNLRAGDVLRLSVDGPAGFAAANELPPLDRNKAVFVAFAGKKRPAAVAVWPDGEYRGMVELLRAGKVVVSHHSRLQLP